MTVNKNGLSDGDALMLFLRGLLRKLVVRTIFLFSSIHACLDSRMYNVRGSIYCLDMIQRIAISAILISVLSNGVANGDEQIPNIAGTWHFDSPQDGTFLGISGDIDETLQITQQGDQVSGVAIVRNDPDGDQQAIFDVYGSIANGSLVLGFSARGDYFGMMFESATLDISPDGNQLDGAFDPSRNNSGYVLGVELHYHRGDFSQVRATVYVWDAAWPFIGFGGSVGHVYIEGDGTYLSTFPVKSSYKNKLVNLSLADTIQRETRGPTWGYVITLSNRSGFDSAMRNYTNRPIWDWYPTGSEQTNCTDSTIQILSAGGLKLPVVRTPHYFAAALQSLVGAYSNGLQVTRMDPSALPQ
jgi:hypothetical protein